MVKEGASLGVGSKVWIEDDEDAWVEGEITAVDKDGKKKMATVRSIKGKEVTGLRLKNLNAMDVDAPPGGVEDMTKLSYLHEPGVMNNLFSRYDVDEIYTYTGQILIAVNPFQALNHLYDDHMMEAYRGKRLGELSPHVFAIAEAAYSAMRDYSKNQSILVSGESGAGKTETTKLIMQYLAHMGGRASEDGRTVESQVLESNPLLEAFGNAKTVRNNNSSRFGKFVEIQFDEAGRISGAAVRTYLLERSRVVQVSDPERNYHCFYQLCAGATEEERERLKLGPPESFHYLNQSKCIEIGGRSTNAQEYTNTRKAMDVVGLTQEEQDSIFSIVAAILHLGNINFAPGKQADSSKVSGDEAKFHLDAAAKILQVDKKGLRESLITRTIVTPEGNIKKDVNPEAAVTTRDTLAKTIYSRLFDWLVNKVNISIGQDPDHVSFIGVLDIYGFESFQVNSFEQFCINLANEKLQQHFNTHVFKAEQDEYTREEIDWSYIEFEDNQDVLELIEKKPTGIMSLLDEQCMFPKSTPETFATKMYQTHTQHKRFKKPKLSQSDFTIDHYAGEVTYQTDLFLDKNKDSWVMEHQELLQASKNPFVAALFPPLESGEKSKSKATSLGARFKQQLADLMSTLNTTEPHYIRCVKPNSKNKPHLFENHNVLQQLRCGGVLEAIRISCAGFPTRKTFIEFVDRFGLLGPEIVASSSDDKEAAKGLVEKMGLTNYQMGKTMVFLRAGQLADLDAARSQKRSEAARVIQRGVRTCMERRRFILLRRAAIKAQAIWRGKMARKLAQSMRRHQGAVRIQKHWRRHSAQTKYKKQRQAAINIQSAARGMAARKRYHEMRREKAAVKLQDAKQTGALQEAKNKLEKQLEEVKWRLDLEKKLRADLEDVRNKQATELESVRKELEAVKTDLDKEREQSKKSLETLEKELEQQKAATEKAVAEAAAAAAAAAAAGPGAGGMEGGETEIKTVVKEVVKVVEVPSVTSPRGAPSTHILAAAGSTEKAAPGEETLRATLSSGATPGSGVPSEGSESAKVKEVEAKLAELNATKEKELLELQSSMKEIKDEYLRMQEQMKVLETENQVLRKQALEAATHPLAPSRSHAPHHAPTAHQRGVSSPVSPPPGSRVALTPLQTPSAEGDISEVAAAALDGSFVTPSPMARPIRAGPPATAPTAAGPLLYPNSPPAPSPVPTETHEKRVRQNMERQQADQDNVLQFVVSDLGFDNNRPMAACLLYKALLHWRSFEAERTTVFDRVIQTIGGAIEGHEGSNGSANGTSNNNDRLAYWLTNSACLLHLLQRSLRPGEGRGTGAGSSTLQRRTSRNAPTLLSRVSQSMRTMTDWSGEASPKQAPAESPKQSGWSADDGLKPVDAKYPAMLFKQQLTAYVEKLFGALRDNIKKEITPSLQACIQTPRTSRVPVGRGRPGQNALERRGSMRGAPAAAAAAAAQATTGAAAPPALNENWTPIIRCLTELLNTLKANFVPPFLIRRLFTQVFAFINVQLFNSLLLRRECCSFSNGEYVKAGLSELEKWIIEAKSEYTGDAWEELKYIRQAVGFLVINQKPKKTFEEITADLCPALTLQQLYRISTMYWDDRYGTQSVSPDVISTMRARITEASAATGQTTNFLLDDDSSIPFTVDDISRNLPNISLKSLTAPPHLRSNSTFSYLYN